MAKPLTTFPIFLLLFLFLHPTHQSPNPTPTPPTPSSPKCHQLCSTDPECLQSCQTQSNEQTIKIIIGTALTFILFFVVFCGCCFIQSHHKFRKFRLMFNSRYRLLKENNRVDRGVIGLGEFRQHVGHFLRLVNTGKREGNFVTVVDGEERVETVVATARQVQPFLHQIQLSGQDSEGEWSASGSIVSTSSGIIIWFYKQYDNDFTKNLKHKSPQFAYVSHPSTLSQITGDWWMFRSNKNAEKKGEWVVRIPVGVGDKGEDSNYQMMMMNN